MSHSHDETKIEDIWWNHTLAVDMKATHTLPSPFGCEWLHTIAQNCHKQWELKHFMLEG